MKMNRAKRVAPEPDHDFSTKADLTSDSESEQDEDFDDSDHLTLENIPGLQSRLSEEDDDEECLGLAAEELEGNISEAVANTTVEDNRESEMEKIRNFDCKCYGRRKNDSSLGIQSCSRKLSPEFMYSVRIASLSAEKEWQDMRIIGHLEANRRSLLTSDMTTSRRKVPVKRKHARTTYTMGGVEVCRTTFQFLMGICRATLTDIIRHFDENGARPRIRKKAPRPQTPRVISRSQMDRVLDFIKNYTEDHAIVPPGRHPECSDWHVKLLPSHVSKASVWRLYMQQEKELGNRVISKSSFKALWNQLLPHIRPCRSCTDLCWQCQQNNEHLIKK